jgi:hypothetical protein
VRSRFWRTMRRERQRTPESPSGTRWQSLEWAQETHISTAMREAGGPAAAAAAAKRRSKARWKRSWARRMREVAKAGKRSPE